MFYFVSYMLTLIVFLYACYCSLLFDSDKPDWCYGHCMGGIKYYYYIHARFQRPCMEYQWPDPEAAQVAEDVAQGILAPVGLCPSPVLRVVQALLPRASDRLVPLPLGSAAVLHSGHPEGSVACRPVPLLRGEGLQVSDMCMLCPLFDLLMKVGHPGITESSGSSDTAVGISPAGFRLDFGFGVEPQPGP